MTDPERADLPIPDDDHLATGSSAGPGTTGQPIDAPPHGDPTNPSGQPRR